VKASWGEEKAAWRWSFLCAVLKTTSHVVQHRILGLAPESFDKHTFVDPTRGMVGGGERLRHFPDEWPEKLKGHLPQSGVASHKQYNTCWRQGPCVVCGPM